MGKKRTVVEINGRSYDATTGHIINQGPQSPQVIDGFRAPINPAGSQTMSQRQQAAQASAIHANQQRTQKLHPAAAKKVIPQPAQITQVRAAEKQLPATQRLDTSRRATQVGQAAATKRALRAMQHQQSQHVQKFGSGNTAPEPLDQPSEEPLAPPVQHMPKASPSQIANTLQPTNTAADEDQKPKLSIFRRRPKLVPTTVTIMAILALGGYYAYQNIPSMALQIASSRAGIEASLPRYRPTGYNFAGPIAYSEGTIELEFASNVDDRSYKITQQESTWDSQSLLSNYIEPITNDYVTFQERGLTIYVYDNYYATWVDSGVWYTIEGNSLMTSEQLLKIADSL